MVCSSSTFTAEKREGEPVLQTSGWATWVKYDGDNMFRNSETEMLPKEAKMFCFSAFAVTNTAKSNEDDND